MVTPFRSNPLQYALYKLMQNGVEVGRIYASGAENARSHEVWQLYTSRITGAGRGAYTWPSYQNAGNESTSAKLEIVYVGTAAAVEPPERAFTNGAEYLQVSAPISSP